MQIKKNNNKHLLAHLYINCALKNTILSLTNEQGQLYKQWSSKSLKKTVNLSSNDRNALKVY